MTDVTSEVMREQTQVPTDRRISVLHMGSPTGLYGAERWILALIKHLPREDVESWVAVIKDAPGLEAPLCEVASELGFRTRVFESYGKISRSAIGALNQFLREKEIDILHTHGYKTDIIGCLAARGTRCKTVSTPHGWGASPGLRVKLYERLDRLALRHFDAVVPLSKSMFKDLRWLRRNANLLHLIENGVDLDEVDLVQSVSSELASVKARGATVIGYVGRLDRGKRLDTLVRAVERVPFPNKHLCIVGDGPERAALEELAHSLLQRHQYAFLGFRSDRISIMRGFDFFVLPSEREGIPRCLMEAMACGVAAIATDIPGCRELIVDQETGLLFQTGNESMLLQKMQELTDDPNLCARLARSGQKRIREHFSATVMARRYQRLYQKLVEPLPLDESTCETV